MSNDRVFFGTILAMPVVWLSCVCGSYISSGCLVRT